MHNYLESYFLFHYLEIKSTWFCLKNKVRKAAIPWYLGEREQTCIFDLIYAISFFEVNSYNVSVTHRVIDLGGFYKVVFSNREWNIVIEFIIKVVWIEM